MKTCTKCGAEKSMEEFCLERRAADGRRTICKTCTALYASARAKSPGGIEVRKRAVRRYLASAKGQETIRRYRQSSRGRAIQKRAARDWRHTEKGKASKLKHQRQYAATAKGKETSRRSVKRAQRRYPEKHRARVILHTAVKRGHIQKGPCARCGVTERVHGHHRDYSRPLDVIWLCVKCHQAEHRGAA